jgi:F0F1-type ATP synthase assembly protein I
VTAPQPQDDKLNAGTGSGAPKGGQGALSLVAIGSVNATCWPAGNFVGWLCDRHFGTLPVFILVGLVIGSVTGALSTYKEVRRYLS